MTETLLRTIDSSLNSLKRIVMVDLWSLISSNHTTIIVLVSIAIAATLIMGAAILIRQQKIMRKLDELAKEAEEPTAEDKP